MMFGDKLSQLTSTFIPDLNLQPTLASMGLSNTPKARMKLFYEKHNPEKVIPPPNRTRLGQDCCLYFSFEINTFRHSSFCSPLLLYVLDLLSSSYLYCWLRWTRLMWSWRSTLETTKPWLENSNPSKRKHHTPATHVRSYCDAMLTNIKTSLAVSL